MTMVGFWVVQPEKHSQSTYVYFLNSDFLLFPLDCTGSIKGPSYSHLALDSDRQHHWRFAAPGPYHFRTVEGTHYISLKLL